MNPFEFVLAIIVVTGIFSLLRHRMGMRSRWDRNGPDGSQNSDENDRLRSHVKQLQDRINVLERIVTDRGAQTAAQIEALRDRDRIDNGDQVQ
jgi:outer membrane murein-binding lipoprotein Lpp